MSLLASKLPVDSFTMLGTEIRDSTGLGGSATALSTEPVVFPSGNRILQHECLFASFVNQSCVTSRMWSFTSLLRPRVVSILFESGVGRIHQLLVQLIFGTVALVQLYP